MSTYIFKNTILLLSLTMLVYLTGAVVSAQDSMDVARYEIHDYLRYDECAEGRIFKVLDILQLEDLNNAGYIGQSVKIAVLDSGIGCQPIHGGISYIEGQSYDVDDFGHGDQVAEIIKGYIPDAELYSVKILNENGVGQIDAITTAAQWSVDQSVDIIFFGFALNEYLSALPETVAAAYTAAFDCSHSGQSYTVAATCTTNGYAYTKCTKCGTKLSSNITTSTLGHSHTREIAPTCKTIGLDHCSTCGVDQFVPPTPHTPIESFIPAGCLSDGYKVVECCNCDTELSRTKISNALGHYFETDVYPTCDLQGRNVCQRCGEIETLGKTGHYFYWKIKPAICTQEGYQYQQCINCPAHTDSISLPKLGHAGEWVYVSAAQHMRRCAGLNCDEINYESHTSTCTKCRRILVTDIAINEKNIELKLNESNVFSKGISLNAPADTILGRIVL